MRLFVRSFGCDDSVKRSVSYMWGCEILIMINGLGATPQSELYLAYRKARLIAEEKGMKVSLSLVGEFFTGLEMGGFSVTYSKLDNEIKELLQEKADTCMFKKM